MTLFNTEALYKNKPLSEYQAQNAWQSLKKSGDEDNRFVPSNWSYLQYFHDNVLCILKF